MRFVSCFGSSFVRTKFEENKTAGRDIMPVTNAPKFSILTPKIQKLVNQGLLYYAVI